MKAVAPYLVLLSIFAVGCTGPTGLSRVEETRKSSPKMIESGDVVTFVRLSGVREDMLDCIHNATRDALPKVHVISPAAFRDSMFPWFEPNNAPGDAEALSKIILSPIVKQKIDDLRARYIVTISGKSV